MHNQRRRVLLAAVLVAFLGIPATPWADQTESEPNSSRGSANGPINFDEALTGGLPGSYGLDSDPFYSDYWSFTGVKDLKYTFTAVPKNVSGLFPLDIDLDIENSSGALVAGSASGGDNQTETLRWTCPANGTYYLVIYEGTQTANGIARYEVTCREAPLAWVLALFPAESAFVKPGREAPVGQVGFEVLGSDDPEGKKVFGSWSYSEDGTQTVFPLIATEAAMTGKIYRARLSFHNPGAATADLCPGYRVEYANVAFTHFGGIEVQTFDPANAPAGSTSFTATVYWAPPFGCSDMDDNGTLADWPLASGTDYRNYTVIFDLFHTQLGDLGVFTLEGFAVEPVPPPASAPVTHPYSDLSAWNDSTIPGGYFQDGGISKSASSIAIQAGVHNPAYSARYIGAFGPVATEVGQLSGNPPCPNNKLVRLSVRASSLNLETTPVTRLYLHAYMSQVGPAPAYRFTRNIVWFDIYGALEAFAKLPTAWGGRSRVSLTQPNPGVPPTGAGTTLTCYAYTHGGYDETNDYLLPDISVLSLNRYTDGLSGWQDDSGGVTFSDVKIEIYP
ncbi:MAG TPA: hypothetical protein VM492_07880 [Sumerlaeia bacterium]|nr:hypothetical protein [Sumerlaeia bacterium]